jgi:hypothetical protein
MFATFRQSLLSCGFKAAPDDKYWLVRGTVFLRQPVAISRNRRNKNEIFLHLSICIKDRFQEPPSYHVALSAYLHPTRVDILLYCDLYIWKREDELAAIDAFMKHGVPWFEAYSRPQVLIQRIEQELREGVPPRVTRKAGILKRYLLKGKPPEKRPRPPVNHYYLSLLYDEIGDSERACFHCKRNLESIAEGDRESLVRDRARILKQLTDMDCGGSADGR